MYNIGAGQIIERGRVLKNVIDRVEWRTCNGILIPGQSRSGKTNSAVFYMSQYAAQGVKLIVCDYNGGIEATLLDQIDHLKGAFLWAPVTDGEQIVDYIEKIHRLAQRRYKNEDTDRTPILFVIDEFTSFIANTDIPHIVTKERRGDEIITTPKATYMQRFVSTLTTAAKVDIKFMVMGQNWVQAGTTSSVRQFRNNFTDIIFHKLTSQDAKLFTNSALTMKHVEGLRAGFAIHNDQLIRVPRMTDEYRAYTEREVAKKHKPVRAPPTDNELLAKLLNEALPAKGEVLQSREVVSEGHTKALEAKPRHSLFRAESAQKSPMRSTSEALPVPIAEMGIRIKRGESDYAIIKAMYGVTGGAKYQLLKSGLQKIRKHYEKDGL